MYAADNPQIQDLFNASARDLRTISFDVDDEIFGFHAQQAAEKLYKALITAHGAEHAFTHNLRKLVEHLTLLQEKPPALPIDLDELSEYAVEFRYESGKPFAPGERDTLRAALMRLEAYVRERADELRRAMTLVKNP
jgi:HEPN domain-containing protein